MSLIISGYSRDAFKEYLLSSLNNADYSHYQVRKTGSPTSPPLARRQQTMKSGNLQNVSPCLVRGQEDKIRGFQ